MMRMRRKWLNFQFWVNCHFKCQWFSKCNINMGLKLLLRRWEWLQQRRTVDAFSNNTPTRTNVYHNSCSNNNGKGQTCIDIVMMVNTCLVSPPPGALGQVSLKCFQSWIPKSYLGIRRSVWAKSKLIMLFTTLNTLSSSTQKGRTMEFSCCFEKHGSCCFAR